jgi:hypothetical protein
LFAEIFDIPKCEEDLQWEVSGKSQKSCVLLWRSVLSYWFKDCRSRYDIWTLVRPSKEIYCKCMAAHLFAQSLKMCLENRETASSHAWGSFILWDLILLVEAVLHIFFTPVVASSIEGIQSTGFMKLS